jgi:hypothetical protein
MVGGLPVHFGKSRQAASPCTPGLFPWEWRAGRAATPNPKGSAMSDTEDFTVRATALDMAVRTGCLEGHPQPADTVLARAEKYRAFLEGDA